MSVVFTYSHTHEAYFKEHGQKLVLKKGSYIVSPHERSDCVYFLVTGTVQACFSFTDGSERLIGYFLPGMSFAQTGAFFNDSGGDLEYVTCSEVTAYRMPYPQFLAQLQNDQAFNQDYIDWLLKVQLLLIERIVYQGEITIRRKILRWMLFMAKYYGQRQQDGGYKIIVPTPRAVIADFIHVSRESIVKEMKRLEPKGYFTQQAKVLTVYTDAIQADIGQH